MEEKFNELMTHELAVNKLKNHLDSHVWKKYDEYLEKNDLILWCYPYDWEIDYIEHSDWIQLVEITFYEDYDKMETLTTIPIEEFI